MADDSVICVVSIIANNGRETSTLVYRQPCGDGQSSTSASSMLATRLKRTLNEGGAHDTDTPTTRHLLNMIDIMVQNETINGTLHLFGNLSSCPLNLQCDCCLDGCVGEIARTLELLVYNDNIPLLAAYDIYVYSGFSRFAWLELWDTIKVLVRKYHPRQQLLAQNERTLYALSMDSTYINQCHNRLPIPRYAML
jgi:hypothetical protein